MPFSRSMGTARTLVVQLRLYPVPACPQRVWQSCVMPTRWRAGSWVGALALSAAMIAAACVLDVSLSTVTRVLLVVLVAVALVVGRPEGVRAYFASIAAAFALMMLFLVALFGLSVVI